MSSNEKNRAVIEQAAEDGDGLAAKMLHDMNEEDRLPGLPKLKRGDFVFIFSAAHYHNGQLIGDDHEFYYLAPGALKVWESGHTTKMHEEQAVDYGETVPVISMVRKATVTDIQLWPYGKVAKSRG